MQFHFVKLEHDLQKLGLKVLRLKVLLHEQTNFEFRSTRKVEYLTKAQEALSKQIMNGFILLLNLSVFSPSSLNQLCSLECSLIIRGLGGSHLISQDLEHIVQTLPLLWASEALEAVIIVILGWSPAYQLLTLSQSSRPRIFGLRTIWLLRSPDQALEAMHLFGY